MYQIICLLRNFDKRSNWVYLIRLVFFLNLFLFLKSEIRAQSSDKIPVLIVDGFSNHDWQQTSAVTQWILEKSGLFKVDISTVPEDSLTMQSWQPVFDQYAVVIQNTNNIHNSTLRWPKDAERALEEYVARGGGLYILHSANNAFAHWEAYNEMIGLGWRPQTVGTALEIDPKGHIKQYPPGEGKGTGHGERFNALIQILNRHPINLGYPDAWQTVNTEVYYFPRGDAKNIEVLSYANDSTSTQQNWPVEWVVEYGKGRVYNSSLGHLWEGEVYPPAYRCAGYQTTVVRVTEWLATGKVDFPVPPDFPTAGSPSLRNPTMEWK
ncbi:Trehalose utilisation [Cyclobacterium lianum]|uniref:Trehalose utilisation n=1 Tax=Cyclobacterium lianum TaxID=388280 RepID=A0A1M7QNY1_9BACT|nr:ThuA domain-containing protein [Cyclobacterium lianum]SHN33191.1 Trehalose utilisation [Cyclobacterium lianum]